MANGRKRINLGVILGPQQRVLTRAAITSVIEGSETLSLDSKTDRSTLQDRLMRALGLDTRS